jgi:hypothetical protein
MQPVYPRVRATTPLIGTTFIVLTTGNGRVVNSCVPTLLRRA